MVVHHQLQVGALIAFFLYVNRFLAPIQLLVQQYNTFQQGQSSVLKLRTLFQTEPSTPEKVGASELPPVEGEIVFEDVSFVDADRRNDGAAAARVIGAAN